MKSNGRKTDRYNFKYQIRCPTADSKKTTSDFLEQTKTNIIFYYVIIMLLQMSKNNIIVKLVPQTIIKYALSNYTIYGKKKNYYTLPKSKPKLNFTHVTKLW